MGMDRGLASWIERRALIASDQLALAHGEVTWTYGELASRVRRLAGGFKELGVERGDRVAWLGENHPAFLEVLFATAKLGAALAPVNHRLDREVITGLMAEYSASVAVIAREALEISLPPSVQHRVVVDDPNTGDVDYEDVAGWSGGDVLDETVGLDDICLVPHTSGTTGMPKGVMLTHGNITWNVINLLSQVDFRSDDVTLAIAPLFRSGGTGVNVMPVLFKGGTVVVPETSAPDEILRLFEERHVTIGFGNPDLLDALTRSPRWASADLTSIRYFITGGAPVPERLIQKYMERGVPFVQGYGITEAAPVVSLLDAPSSLRKVGSAGKPPLFIDVRTVRPDGSACEPNEAGELLVRGPNVMAGYWMRPDETRGAIDDDGWLRTGDAARIDDEGYLWIIDRVVDAYESTGHLVYPGDIERALGKHPAVADVGIVAHGGVSTAFVVLAADAATSQHELLEFCQRRLREYEVPSAVVFVDKLPRSSVGKLLRGELSVGK